MVYTPTRVMGGAERGQEEVGGEMAHQDGARVKEGQEALVEEGSSVVLLREEGRLEEDEPDGRVTGAGGLHVRKGWAHAVARRSPKGNHR